MFTGVAQRFGDVECGRQGKISHGGTDAPAYPRSIAWYTTVTCNSNEKVYLERSWCTRGKQVADQDQDCGFIGHRSSHGHLESVRDVVGHKRPARRSGVRAKGADFDCICC